MRGRNSSSDSDGDHKKRHSSSDETIFNIRTKPPHIYDNLTRKLLKLGITLAITTFIGLIVRYAVQEFDPSVSTITVTTSKVNNRDIASLSVSKHFLERILEFIEESIAIVAAIIPIGFPICTLLNKYFAKIRAGVDKIDINSDKVLNIIPKYVIIGDAEACKLPNSTRLRPLVRDTIYQLIKSHLKPKLIVEDSYDEARKLGIRIGLIKREHHKLAVIKSVDLLKNIIDSRGDIKQGKVRYLLSRMKIMSQATPADKSLLIYLIKHCESMPNENIIYLGYSFTDPEAMRLADCSITFQDCDDDDVKKESQIILKSDNMTFTDLYLFSIVCLLTSNITQSYALYQLSASVSCCLYKFLSITVFQDQLISHSQFSLLIIIQQLFAIIALMTKWLSSLPQAPLRSSTLAEMSHDVTEDVMAIDSMKINNHSKRSSTGGGVKGKSHHHRHHQQYRSTNSLSATANSSGGAGAGAGRAGAGGATTTTINTFESSTTSLNQLPIVNSTIEIPTITGNQLSLENNGQRNKQKTATSVKMQKNDHNEDDDTLGSSSNIDSSSSSSSLYSKLDQEQTNYGNNYIRSKSKSDLNTINGSRGKLSSIGGNYHDGTVLTRKRQKNSNESNQHIHLSGIDLNKAVINSNLVTSYKQIFHNSTLIDDVTYRLVKLQIAYQVLVMIIIMIFGNAMFQLNMNNNRQHQTLAFNSLILNNIFNLANCFNQFGEFNLRTGFKNHPFFVCVLLFAVFFQVCLSELNAFGLENLNPIQWFVCFVFAILSSLISPLTGQQQRYRTTSKDNNYNAMHDIQLLEQTNNKQDYYREHHSPKTNRVSKSSNGRRKSGKNSRSNKQNVIRKYQSEKVLDD